MKLFGVVLICILLCSCTKASGKNIEDLNEFLNSYFQETISRNPEFAANIGMTNDMGFHFSRNVLNDMSESAAEAEMEIIRAYR